ncbi:hypothetical protein EDD16DRAFT_557936 [Pisolithus croceorrhizus]|nr:hypothetical protein EDD16DRAFT_557936 [Pisolithus croceorrhizus]
MVDRTSRSTFYLWSDESSEGSDVCHVAFCHDQDCPSVPYHCSQWRLLTQSYSCLHSLWCEGTTVVQHLETLEDVHEGRTHCGKVNCSYRCVSHFTVWDSQRGTTYCSPQQLPTHLADDWHGSNHTYGVVSACMRFGRAATQEYLFKSPSPSPPSSAQGRTLQSAIAFARLCKCTPGFAEVADYDQGTNVSLQCAVLHTSSVYTFKGLTAGPSLFCFLPIRRISR